MFDREEKAHLVFGWHHPIGWSSEQKGESRVSTSIHLLFPNHWYNVTICLMLLLTWLPIMLDYTLGLWVKVNLPNLCSFCQVFGHSDKSATNVVFFPAHPFFKKPITFTWHCESRRKGFRVKELFWSYKNYESQRLSSLISAYSTGLRKFKKRLREKRMRIFLYRHSLWVNYKIVNLTV
jgi:hypothetical protein